MMLVAVQKMVAVTSLFHRVSDCLRNCPWTVQIVVKMLAFSVELSLLYYSCQL
jgi:hypothetical protein